MARLMMRTPIPVSVGGKVVAEGPLVVPSYSSKALPRISVGTTLENTASFIVSPVLISAYDVCHHEVDLGVFDVPLIIVDSGGYETLVDEEGLKRGGDHARFPWSPLLYAETLAKIRSDVPVITVSYDNTKLPIREQIDVALEARNANLGSAFLLKPRENESLTIESVTDHASKLEGFDVIGVTEKEAGASFLERVTFIARLRHLLDESGVAKPIHVFGGLDPFMTPLYFLAGADIVDGLSWLRFGFSDTGAHYLPAQAAMTDPRAALQETEWRIRRANYFRAVDMQVAIRRFLREGDYNVFSMKKELVQAIADVHGAMLRDLDSLP